MHSNGQLSYKVFWDDGEQTGDWEYYYANGQIEHKGSWEEGLKDGLWEYYLEDGKHAASVLFSKGREWKVIEFDRFGQPKNQGEYEEFNKMVANKDEIEAQESKRGQRKMKRKAKRAKKKKAKQEAKEAKQKMKALEG